jgi:YggT family protein
VILLIERLNQFIFSATVTGIMLVILVIVLRLIANAVDINPFSWSAITIRRLTEPLLGPVRRGLIGFRVDPKFAPFVTILLTCLIGWLFLQVTSNVLTTITGVVSALQAHAPARLVGHLLYGFLALYGLLIFIRIICSWLMVSYSHGLMRFLVNTTEPLLGPLRRTIPPVGMFDISALVALIIIWLFQQAVAGTLLK